MKVRYVPDLANKEPFCFTVRHYSNGDGKDPNEFTLLFFYPISINIIGRGQDTNCSNRILKR